MKLNYRKHTYKTALLSLAVLLLLTVGCKKGNNDTRLVIQNVSSGDVFTLKVYDTTGLVQVNAAKKLKEGQMRFRFNSEFPFIYILESGDYKNELILSPGGKTILDYPTGKLSEVIATENSNFQEYIRAIRRIEHKADSLSYVFAESQSTDSFPLVKERINIQFETLLNQANEISKNYIQENPTSIAVFNVINRALKQSPVFNFRIDFEWFVRTDSLLKANHPGHPYTIWLSGKVRYLKTIVGDPEAESRKIKPGSKISYIKLPALNGSNAEIKPVTDGLTVLHLWNQSIRSREVNKQIKQLHDKFKARNFLLYSICFDENSKRWSSSVTLDKMWWNNLIDTTGARSKILSSLNHPRLPSFIAIDGNNTVLGYFTSTEALERWADQYFSRNTSKKQLN